MQRSKSWCAGQGAESPVLRQQEIANPAYDNVQEQPADQEKAREDQWRQWKMQAPRALQAAPEETLLFFKRITDDVAEWGHLPDFGKEIDYSAQRLLCMALFCQTKDVLITAHSKNVSLWSVLNNCKKKIEALDGGAITDQDRAIIYQLCRDEAIGAHHDDQTCMGKSTICKNCKRLISVVSCIATIGNCCKESVVPTSIVRGYEGSACPPCTEKLRHKLLLRLKSLIIGFHQFQLVPKSEEDIALIRWAICFQK